jgi:Extended Signal Peptide of Type V secretion system
LAIPPSSLILAISTSAALRRSASAVIACFTLATMSTTFRLACSVACLSCRMRMIRSTMAVKAMDTRLAAVVNPVGGSRPEWGGCAPQSRFKAVLDRFAQNFIECLSASFGSIPNDQKNVPRWSPAMNNNSSLNHTYRLVWSDALFPWVAVAEHVKGRGKSQAGRAAARLTSRVVSRAAALLTGTALSGMAGLALAGPTGGVVTSGQVFLALFQ